MADIQRNHRGAQPKTTRNPTKSATPDAPHKSEQDTTTADVRNHLAIMMTALLVILALVAAVQTGAMPVIQVLLPLVGTIFGFFFGYRVGRTR